MTIVVGLHNKDVTDATAQRIRASDHFQHEDYDYDEGTNNLADDIMLIRLEVGLSKPYVYYNTN